MRRCGYDTGPVSLVVEPGSTPYRTKPIAPNTTEGNPDPMLLIGRPLVTTAVATVSLLGVLLVAAFLRSEFTFFSPDRSKAARDLDRRQRQAGAGGGAKERVTSGDPEATAFDPACFDERDEAAIARLRERIAALNVALDQGRLPSEADRAAWSRPECEKLRAIHVSLGPDRSAAYFALVAARTHEENIRAWLLDDVRDWLVPHMRENAFSRAGSYVLGSLPRGPAEDILIELWPVHGAAWIPDVRTWTNLVSRVGSPEFFPVLAGFLPGIRNPKSQLAWLDTAIHLESSHRNVEFWAQVLTPVARALLKKTIETACSDDLILAAAGRVARLESRPIGDVLLDRWSLIPPEGRGKRRLLRLLQARTRGDFTKSAWQDFKKTVK